MANDYEPDPREKPLAWTPSAGLGNSSSQQVYTGAAPPSAPDDPTLPAVFYPTSGGPIQQWDVPTLAWV